MMFWAVCCVTLAVGSVCTSAAPRSEISHPIDWTQLESAPDDESVDYAVSPGRYPSAPWLYLLAEAPRDSQLVLMSVNGKGDGRVKRRMPSLSIDLPMSVLRQKLSLEKERKFQAIRAAANRDYLNDIGKRGILWNAAFDSEKY